MAVISGLAGTVTLAGTTFASIFAWRMNLVRRVFRYTVWGTLTGDPAIADSYTASGVIDCYLDSDISLDVAQFNADATSAALVLKGTAAITVYSMNAHLSALDTGVSRQSAPGTISFGFESDGAIVMSGL